MNNMANSIEDLMEYAEYDKYDNVYRIDFTRDDVREKLGWGKSNPIEDPNPTEHRHSPSCGFIKSFKIDK